MHETDFNHEHVETAAERAAIARTIWDQDNVAFKTVGIDIGSSTSPERRASMRSYLQLA